MNSTFKFQHSMLPQPNKSQNDKSIAGKSIVLLWWGESLTPDLNRVTRHTVSEASVSAGGSGGKGRMRGGIVTQGRRGAEVGKAEADQGRGGKA